MSRCKQVIFTLNNYTPEQKDAICLLVERHPTDVSYVLFGQEVGEQGTPHLQGLILLKRRLRFNQIKDLVGFSLHLELMRGTFAQASTYCKKDGDWLEFGEEPPVTQGKRTDLDTIIDWIKEFIGENDRAPSAFDIAQEHPKALIKYRNLPSVARLMVPKVPSNFQTGDPRPWQTTLEEELDIPSEDDRKIMFFVDPVGNTGKTWFTRYYFGKHPDSTQILGTGSYIDLAYMIDEINSVFFFNVPRGGMEFFPYRLALPLKNR